LSSSIIRKSYLELSETSKEPCLYELPFNTPRVHGSKRIGPHPQDVYSIIFGSLLGDGHMEKGKEGSRIKFYQGADNSEYILWLHSLMVQFGYCKNNPPILQSRLLKDGRKSSFMRFDSFTFTSFN
jgi:ubiquinol-cytochrome c reductase cytochrome b subunit